jgi:peptide/nickel transport system substrate-binding protein
VVYIRVLADLQTLYLNILAGQVDVFPDNTLNGDVVFELQERWDAAGSGTSYIKFASTRFLAPQWRPNVQAEPAVLDLKVRAALYHALDRDTMAEVFNGGHREMAAWEILPPDDVNYPAVKDGFRQYAFDPDRARSLLREAGWTPGPDGMLRNDGDGRRFRASILGFPSGIPERELSTFANYWNQIGIETEVAVMSFAQAGDPETRSLFPSWTATAAGVGDGILSRLVGPVATAENRWQGNPGGYNDPRGQALVDRYRASVSPRDQLDAMKSISDFWAAELPVLVLYTGTHSVGRRTGVIALDDQAGGGNASFPYGTFTRNAHLWDLAG